MENGPIERPKYDRCDLLDVLEEAAMAKQPISVRLEDGRSFEDRVTDVVTTGGRDFVDFAEQGRVPVADVVSATRARVTLEE